MAVAVAATHGKAPRTQHAKARTAGATGRSSVRAVAAQAAAPAAVIPPGALRISLGNPVGRPIAPSFLGLSIEYSSAISYLGTDPQRVDPVFLQLLRNIDPGQSPVLRFGGDTTDWSWWPVPGVAKPPGVRYALGLPWTSVVHAMATILNAKLILGIQFEADSSRVADYEATRLLAGVGAEHVAGLELGNEPEVYGDLGWYANKAGEPVPGRPRSYNVAAFLPDYKKIAATLPTTVPLVGPATGAPLYQAAIPKFLTAEPRVKTVTIHRYPLRRCGTPASSPESPTIAHLLARTSSDGLAQTLTQTVAAAHAVSDTLRVDELNGVSCGGDLGVTNTFAASLWSLDTLFAMARVGVDGVNIHTFQNAWYEPFAFSNTDGIWHANVMPLYYGMLAFAQAAPPGSRLLKVLAPPFATLRLWATRGVQGTVRVVLINEAPSAATTIAVPAPAGAHAATLSRLTAPSLAATSGVSLGGRSFVPDTTTGLLSGTPQTTTLTRVQGSYVVTLPAASAAILTIPTSP